MERIKGLNEYVKNEKYRKALNLPNEQEEEYTMLAQGEYNINYSFTHPKTGKKLLLRVNCGSHQSLTVAGHHRLFPPFFRDFRAFGIFRHGKNMRPRP